MLLLVDAGNTRIKWALMARAALADAPLGHWSSYGTVRREDLEQLSQAWRGAGIAHVLVSNVAGSETSELLENLLLRAAGIKPVPIEWFKSVASLAGVRNGYRNPGQLGSDRFAAAIGAHALYPGRALTIVTCGTATTIDAVTADGVFLGGMILPGLATMARSLAVSTAQLPQIAEQLGSIAAFPDNTDDAIAAGCVAAQAGAIERAFAAHARQQGGAQCIISGGAAAMIAPHLSIPCDKVENLVLTGLQAVAMSQHSPC
jgi:type III pantothenate kinase